MKIFIVGPSNINKLDYANSFIEINDNYNICRHFISDKKFDGMIGEYIFHMDIDEINIAFKNNAFYFIDYNDENITGITFDDYYSSNIICVDMYHFNLIPTFLFEKEEILIVWLDSKSNEINVSKEIVETKYFLETIENMNIPYLYFLNEDTNIVRNIVLEYIDSDEETKQQILEENN